ncbi:TonB-dependent receptor [Dysgonomonas sp. Marseille-P4677]|uniref:SusC/RagA family TonB-linked outer membrane protein n=1 Tax=Dysgonomonas sp. Marseille-P4677 TaxID=2364790 RepID=UPI001911EBF4|nr:TonB-dependent receptor [Dysgonomonas sp. Marseille-P4677]MBK5720987.1 TonB-dependent receptor [Dysgonomonas sp. Marseille-P4677]
MKNCEKLILWAFICSVMLMLSNIDVYAYTHPEVAKGSEIGVLASVPTQQKKIQGSVKDGAGEPLVGASVTIKGTTNATMTDIDGKFSLTVNPGSVIVVTYIGYHTKEVTIDSKNDYDIELVEDSHIMDDVIVVGYGTMKKQNLTGAVSAVKFDEALSSRPTMNLSSALTGLSAGLNISQLSGTPGAEDVNILVRGRGTMNDASPLVIIDGVPGALNDVNPNDVESVSVLKDAASSAIYGSRAANGVILVTTKRGNEGKVNVTYSGYVGWQKAAKKVDFINDMATHMELVNESEGREKYPVSLIEQWRTESAAGNPLYPSTDWYDEMLNTSVMTEHNLTVRGGGKNTNFSMSLGYLDNKGIIDNSGYKKYTFRINVDSKVTNWLDMGGNVYGSWSDRDPINVTSFYDNIRNTTPGVIPQYEDGRYGGTMFENFPRVGNPRAYIDNIRGNYERQKLGLKAYTKVKFLKYLEWENSFGFNYDNRNNWEYTRPYSLWNFQTGYEYQASSNIDKLFNGTRRDYTTVLNSLLRFNYSLNKEHNFAVMLGFDQQYNRMDKFDARKGDILGDDAIYIMDAGVENEAITGSGTDDALRSYFGRINYDYKGKYLVEVNARYDGSSRFHKDNRWGFFPSFSGGWRLTEESFAQPLKNIFDDVKIRGSWGKLGNNRIGDYGYQVVYGSLLYPFGGQLQQGVAPKELANSKIKWETTTMTNIGLDLVLLKNRLSFSAEYYNKNTTDLLTTIPIPLVFGNFTPPWQNIAEMSNKGMEFQLTYHGNVGKDFTYSVSGNLSTISNEVTKYNGDKSISGATITQEGKPYQSFYVLEFDRIIQDQAEIDQLIADGYKFGTSIGGTPKPGDMLYKDTDGNKTFDLDDRVIKDYSSLPKMTYGINLSAAYKGIDLNIVGQGVSGARGYWGNDGFNTFNINEGFLQRAEVLNRWTPENKSTEYPRLLTSGSALNTANSDYWLYNTSYFRIKSIQMGYTLPKKLSSKFMVERLRVYTNLENYFTFTSFDGYNPENSSMAYPLMKQWVIGLNVTF